MADLQNITASSLPFAVQYAWVILALPLLSLLLNGLWTCRKNQELSAWFSTGLSGLSLVWALVAAAGWWDVTSGEASAFAHRTLVAFDWRWLPMGGDLVARLGILLDPISVMMLVVITVIAFLVHIYSIGYMHDDPSRGRFFPLLSLFVFSMLGLVLSTNLFQMFIFWELVGISSYLLIGFWYHKPSAVAASKKAFIVTRFADAFFLLGIIITAWINGSFDFGVLNSPESWAKMNTTVTLGFFSINALSVATVFVFAGGWGKSAMFPLHIWLPDAMEGPTPVSSIIHSATMVVAGVYLTARMFPLFAAAPHTLDIIAVVGSITAAFAAIIAITQRDIKRILAFSTLSQLGYMMFSLGVSKMAGPEGGINALGYTASMFHVFTHAFFKCMLFLVAGAVIHAVHSNDIGAMGGLRRKLPNIHWSALIATLSIAGVPPLAGFWSKDEIVMTAFQSGHPIIGTVALLVGGLTALYMGRFFFLIFWGEPRSDLHHAHEDKFMTLPIVLLAVPSLFAGLWARHWFSEFMVPSMELAEAVEHHIAWIPFVASGLGIGGIVLAWYMYGRKGANLEAALKLEGRPTLYKWTYDKFYIDKAWYWFAHNFMIEKVSHGIKWFDREIIDGAMNLTGALIRSGGWFVHTLQTGRLAFYLAVTSFGIIFLWYLGNLPL